MNVFVKPGRALLRSLLFAPAITSSLLAQQSLSSIPQFPLRSDPITIVRGARAVEPFSVAGERGAILGQQDGRFELWALPVKMLSNLRITAELAGYPVPIDLNQQAAIIEVSPDHTTVTYSHAAIVVKQHMFIPRGEGTKDAANLAAVVLFEIHSTRAARITFSFDPAMVQMWPAPNFGPASASWVKMGTGGGYLLSTSNPKLFGVVAMPGSTPGILAQDQEKPAYYPLQLRLDYDPVRDAGRFFPLLAAASDPAAIADAGETRKALLDGIVAASQRIPQMYQQVAEFYAHYFDRRLTVDTPDTHFDQALRWSQIAIEQTRVRSHPQNPADTEIGLAAGWFSSGDSARPGYGWFFGRDTLWSLYAINSTGDFALSRQALDFLVRRQRADGKIMHEYSQTAETIDWEHTPYEYAAADSNPLFVLAMEDYVRNSGELAYLKRNWQSVQKAYRFTRQHTSNGVYDNTQGTGWVEAWPPVMPHQEFYLAALDQQSAEAFSRLAALMDDKALAEESRRQAVAIRQQLHTYHEPTGFYAFSRNTDLTLDTTHTIFPAAAWWTGRLKLDGADPMFREWASAHISTDWGTRSITDTAPQYDPMTYHQGTVWPLFTGWASLAEYRADRPLSGYQHLLQNLELTWAQDLGSATELLSGAFYQPLGRSSSHQLWSSAMITSPAIRGLFGLEVDALHGNLRIAPQLPAAWNDASIHHIAFGSQMLDLSMRRQGSSLHVEVESPEPAVLCLGESAYFADQPCRTNASRHHSIELPLPPVEVSLPSAQLEPGDSTHGLKVLAEERRDRRLTLILSAPAESRQSLALRINTSKPSTLKFTVDGATQRKEDQKTLLDVSFPSGTGYQNKTVTITW